MSMTVAEARKEIKNDFEKAELIEKKYPDGVIDNTEDEAEVKRLLTEIDELEARLNVLETAEGRHSRIVEGLERYSKPTGQPPKPTHEVDPAERKMILSPGDQFINDYGYRQLKANGSFNSQLNRVTFAVPLSNGTSLISWSKKLAYEQKVTALYGSSATSGGPFVQNDLRPGAVLIAQNDLNLMTLIPRVTTSSDTVEYVAESTFTNAAAVVAEATGTTGTPGLKPYSALAYETKTSSVQSIAHWIPVTNRLLADAPAIRGIVNGRLLLGLDLTLEAECVTGAGTGSHFLGFFGSGAGINGQPKGTDNDVDAIFKGRTKVRTVGKGRPNAIAMNPADWEAIRLSRENVATGTLGGYLMGPPSSSAYTTLWGLPVIECDAITATKVLVGDFSQGCTLFDREQANIRVGSIDDQFIRNQQTILAELRAAFVIWRPSMFTAVTGM